MNSSSRRSSQSIAISIAVAISFAAMAVPLLTAQSPQLQEKVAAIKEASMRNKQSLARYTWQEQQTISVKGEVKKQMLYQVQMGPDGKPQKTELSESPQPQASSDDNGGGRRGRLKEKVVEKKKSEFKEYGQQIAALAQSYGQHDPQRLQAAFQQGNVTLGSAGAPGQIQLVIHSYLKPNDSVKLTFNSQMKALQSVSVTSYLDSPSDAVTMDIQFSRLPDGTNYASQVFVNGESKKLTVAIQNANYQLM